MPQYLGFHLQKWWHKWQKLQPQMAQPFAICAIDPAICATTGQSAEKQDFLSVTNGIERQILCDAKTRLRILSNPFFSLHKTQFGRGISPRCGSCETLRANGADV